MTYLEPIYTRDPNETTPILEQIQSGAINPVMEIVTENRGVIFTTLTDQRRLDQQQARRANRLAAAETRLARYDAIPAADRNDFDKADIERLREIIRIEGDDGLFNERIAAAGIIQVEGLRYSEDRTKNVAGEMSVTLKNAERLLPAQLQNVANPWGRTEIHLYWPGTTEDTESYNDPDRGNVLVLQPGAITDPVEIGRYLIDVSTFTLNNDDTVDIAIVGKDRLQQFTDIAPLDNYEIPEGTNPVAKIVELIKTFDPDSRIRTTSTPARVGPMSWEAGTSYMQIIKDIADAAQLSVYVDRDGVYIIGLRGQASLAGTLFDGYTSADVLSAARTITRNGVINTVVVRGESLTSGADPVEAQVSADDQTTLAGPMPLVIIDRGIETEEQAQARASSELANQSGVPETLSVVVLTDPRIQPGDSVPIDVPEIGASGRWVVASVTASGGGDLGNISTISFEERRNAARG